MVMQRVLPYTEKLNYTCAQEYAHVVYWLPCKPVSYHHYWAIRYIQNYPEDGISMFLRNAALLWEIHGLQTTTVMGNLDTGEVSSRRCGIHGCTLVGNTWTTKKPRKERANGTELTDTHKTWCITNGQNDPPPPLVKVPPGTSVNSSAACEGCSIQTATDQRDRRLHLFAEPTGGGRMWSVIGQNTVISRC
jgi:hypothetical protein